MPTQRIESAVGTFTVWGSAIAFVADILKWMSENVAFITASTLVLGFVIQVIVSIYNQKRASEKHELEMSILRGEMADRRTVARIDKLDGDE